eukprot:SRR837773.2081.p1 GENE.SRR837773.2081~~SRR837773.2081.p1  ORF type:complete len:283 (-),score=48.28 SRR837773.2081:140-940(-)
MGRTAQPAAADAGAAAAAAPPLLSEGGTTLVTFDELLDFTLEGLAQSFDTRVKQVLQSQASIVVVYKVAQVFSFFAKTLEEALHRADATLVVMCRDLRTTTYQAFLDLWERQAQRLRQGVAGVYVSELGAPAFVAEAVSTLTEVLAIYDMAPVPAEERQADFLPVLSAAFDPLLNHCQQVAAMMDPSDGQVFLLNCISAMQAPLRSMPSRRSGWRCTARCWRSTASGSWPASRPRCWRSSASRSGCRRCGPSPRARRCPRSWSCTP